MSLVKDHIQELKAYEPGLQPEEGDRVIKLNTNENPYPPSPLVLEKIREEASATLRLYPDPRSLKLRQTAASLYGLSPEQVLCGNGSDEILGILLRTFAARGDTIGYYLPSYSYYATLGAIHALKLQPTPLGNPPTSPPLPENSNLAIFFLTNPNSPLGFSLAPEFVAQLARHLKGLLVVDEAYADFASWNCLRLCGRIPNVILTRSFSKSYSMAGLRVGMAFGPADLIRQMNKVRDHYNLNRLAQAAAIVSLQEHGFFEQNKNRILKTRQRLFDALCGLGLDPIPSEANFVFARLGSRERARQVFEQLMQRRILVRHFDQQGLDDGLRISIGTDLETDLLLQALRDLV